MPQAKTINSSSNLSPRLQELQQKIHDDSYINNAIDRIAVIMSRHIVDSHNQSCNSQDFLMQ